MRIRLMALLLVPLIVACESVDSRGGTQTITLNTAPQITAVPDQKMGTLGLIGPVSLVLSDTETSSEDLDVSASSSNTDVIPNSGISITESNGVWTAQIQQSRIDANHFGTLGDTDITVTVSDGQLAGSTTFKVTVLPRINQYVAMGTHNSYHEESPNATLVADWNYSHDDLDKQLLQHRVRSFELDIHWSPSQYMQVYHVSGLDDVTMCDRFGADPLQQGGGCLEMIKAGLDANPNSLPAMVMIEPKDVLPQDPQEGSINGHWRDFDDDIRAVFPEPAEGEEDQLITPAQILGTCDTLAEAVRFDTTCGGWPHIDEARGKLLIFIMASSDCTRHGRDYRGVSYEVEGDDIDNDFTEECYPDVEPNPIANWLAFIENETGPNAAISRCDSPTGGCFGLANLAEAAKTGVLIRTRSDTPPSNNAEQCATGGPQNCTDYTPVCDFDYAPEIEGYRTRLAAALASGGHMISTEHPAANYPDDEADECGSNDSYKDWLAYFATVDGKGTAVAGDPSALCNPANAPVGCADSMFADQAP
ncbi:MAG: Ca2+-dependent phosphoinositide-specific phospholipase C [Gammaproteobacteria bacterium]|nr:Ca2+-dependent phosphoinositide-specific phospholipase C [Gammaproteobacteria bacterium]